MNTVFLSRRNLLTLLSKLDRQRNGEYTACTIIKHDTTHPKYPCSDSTKIVAIEDDEYYTERLPGEVHLMDDPTGA